LIDPTKIKEIIPEEFFAIQDKQVEKENEEKQKRLKEEKEREK